MHRHDLQSLALVNRVFFDAADLWIWRDVALRIMANCPFTPMQRRLNALLRRSDQGKMLRNLQLLFDANLPDPYIEYFRTGVGELLVRPNSLKGLTLMDTYGDLEFPLLIDRIQSSIQFRLVELTFHLGVTSELWDFVLSQRRIQRLVLNWHCGHSYAPSRISSDALPQLQAILAPIALVIKLLPGRPVKCVAAQSPDISPSQFRSLWRAIGKSTAVLTALSVRVDSARAFQTLLRELPHQASSLRFLGIDTGASFLGQWIQPSTAPLRSLESLECIRWESKVPSPGYKRMAWSSNPTKYAGSRLRYVQHEIWTFPGGPGEFEGTWELVEERGGMCWKLQPHFIAPRVGFRQQGLVHS